MTSATNQRSKELTSPEKNDERKNYFGIAKRLILKSIVFLGIFTLGYNGFSIAWLLAPFTLTIIREQERKEREFSLLRACLTSFESEKEMIESRTKKNELPPWVFFPEKERPQWVNQIISELWPNIEDFARQVVKRSIEPAIKKKLNSSSFSFDMIAFGETPPAITGIKISDKCTSLDTIIIDADLMFDSNGDIGFTVKNMKANVIDFHLEGTLRIVLKPLVTKVPLIGGVQIYFPTAPKIKFDLGGLGNLATLVGMKEKIHSAVLEKIEDILVLPNKITKSFRKEISEKELQYPNPSGVLRVHLIKAENLVNKDTGGTSDPYAKLSASTKWFKSKTIKNDLNPKWDDFMVHFPIELLGEELLIELFDHDRINDETLGHATISAGTVAHRKQIDDMWVNLENTTTGKVKLSLSWLEVSNAMEDIEILKKKESKMCLLVVFIDSCKDLKAKSGLPSPYVAMTIESGEKQLTRIKSSTNDPIFEQGFSFVVANPHNDKLKIKVFDSSERYCSTGDTVLGKLDIDVWDRLHMMNMGDSKPQPLDLIGGNGRIMLSAKVLALNDPIV